MSRPSIGWVRKRVHGGIGMHRHALDEPDEEAERARARADDDRRAQRDRAGTASSSSSSTRRRLAMCGRDRPGGQDAAEVDDAADARARGGLGERGARPPPRARRTRRCRPLHGVDEVVGDVGALERLVQAGAGQHVALHERDVAGRPTARRVAGEADELVAVALQPRHERAADVAGDAGQEDAHPAAPTLSACRSTLTSPSSAPGSSGSPSRASCCERRPRAKVVVLEREDAVGLHQTGHNSGVIHAGIYYAAGLAEGSAVRRRRTKRHVRVLRGARHRAREGRQAHRRDSARTSSTASTSSSAAAAPTASRACGAWTRDGLREIEPHCTGVAALHSPETGIADFPARRPRAGRRRPRARRRDPACGAEVAGDERRRRGASSVRTRRRRRRGAERAVVCAGLWADRMAVAAGAPGDPRIVPFRGAYLRMKPDAQHLVKRAHLPGARSRAPVPRRPPHAPRQRRGVARPDRAARRRARRVRAAHRPPARRREALGWPGTWKVMRRFWRTGRDELRMATSHRAFVAACQAYVPELRPEHVERTAAPPASAPRRSAGTAGSSTTSCSPRPRGRCTCATRRAPRRPRRSALASMIADRVENARS